MQYTYYQYRLSLLFVSALLFLFSYQTYANRVKHVEIAKLFVGHTEVKTNRSALIDTVNNHVKNPLGSPYCAAFVYWILDKANVNYDTKKSGLARSLVSKKYTFSSSSVLLGINKIQKGDILIWKKGETIFGHTGFAYSNWNGKKGYTIEANTSSGNNGSQSNGDGIYKRYREIKPYDYFRINWITRFEYD